MKKQEVEITEDLKVKMALYSVENATELIKKLDEHVCFLVSVLNGINKATDRWRGGK